MQMIPVASSNISSIGYENGTLYVAFNRGGLYAYLNVPENIYHALMSASSHGEYLARYVKGVYPYQKIR
ncbi:MAG: KTSC domain-containing protein [Oscillospiraceae bacterium]|nr:KTSC domain-containing protein [Oscillospiraceae bacterium]